MSKKRTYFSESAKWNNGTYNFYFDRLKELATTMFEWKNLPDTVDSRFLEMILFTDGQAVFFRDEDLATRDINSQALDGGFLALQVVTKGKLNVYRVPINRRAYAINGYSKNLNINNSVIIYNNYLRSNSYRMCTMYAKRLYNLDRISDVNANAQKTPVLLQAPEQQ